MLIFPNAKINIGLHVLSNRVDGYHNIETILYPIGWYDVLEIILSSSKTKLILSGIPQNEETIYNLVYKAYCLLKQQFQLPEITIYLRKNIPTGTGLGGGSSDGAFMLRLLNDFFYLHLSSKQLEIKAAKLGSDCPFFIHNQPALASKKGTSISQLNLSLKDYEIVVVTPNIFISTKEAYANVVPRIPKECLRASIQRPIHQWKEYIKNDFESIVFSMYLEIKEIKQELYDKGAIYASMSGSGSSIFGLFKRSFIYSKKISFSFPIHHFI